MSYSKKHRNSKSGLLLIALLLAGSGIIRIGLHTGPALARDTVEVLEGDDTPTLAPVDFSAAVDALANREKKVAEQEERLEARLEVLEAAEQKYQASKAELIEAERELKDTIAQAETAMASDVEQLAKVYEKMKPKDAAALFSQMDPEFAAGFLALVNSEVAAKIMSGLTPAKAYAISVLLAGRNADVPSE